jgi:IclR family acetate operon transcriptional repressor
MRELDAPVERLRPSRQLEAGRMRSADRPDDLAPDGARDGSVRAVERSLRVLEALSRRPDGAAASDLARTLGLPVSTTHRLLVTLQGRGFATCSRGTALWRIGRMAFFVGSAFSPDGDLTPYALPVIRELGRASGETINLGRIEGGKVVFLARFDPRAGQCSSPPPSNVPAHCSSIGKAILGSSEDAAVLPPLAGPLPRLTPNSIRAPSELFRQLGVARTAGFAVDDEENTVGLRCVAAPIFDERGRPVAAISVAAPVTRLSRDELPTKGMIVARAARRITSVLGGAEPKRA